MGRDLDVQWFDDIYSSGDKPSLEQRAALSARDQLPFTQRAKDQIVERLKGYLHQLKQNGNNSRGLQAITYDLLIGILPRTGMDLSEVNQYIGQYRSALAKNNKDMHLTANFS